MTVRELIEALEELEHEGDSVDDFTVGAYTEWGFESFDLAEVTEGRDDSIAVVLQWSVGEIPA
jgi:hypothetical protein